MALHMKTAYRSMMDAQQALYAAAHDFRLDGMPKTADHLSGMADSLSDQLDLIEALTIAEMSE